MGDGGVFVVGTGEKEVAGARPIRRLHQQIRAPIPVEVGLFGHAVRVKGRGNGNQQVIERDEVDDGDRRGQVVGLRHGNAEGSGEKNRTHHTRRRKKAAQAR